jgi:ABC-type glycerol-3-phosphate transport system substrate-binding protein
MAGLSGKHTRKGFLKGMATLGLGLAAGEGLAACGAPTAQAPSTPQVVEREVTRVVPGTPQVIEKVATVQVAAKGPTRVIIAGYGFMLNEVRMAYFSTKYNGEQDKIIIQPELLPPGPWFQKLAAEVKENQVRYNIILYANSYSNTPQFAGMGIIQPIDTYLKVSSAKDAVARYDQMFGPAKPSASYQGKLYGYPLGIQYTSLTMRKDLAEAAGYQGDISSSYDELAKAATMIRDKFSDRKILGLSLQEESGNGTLSYMLWSVTDKPFTRFQAGNQELSILDFKGPGFLKVLNLVKSWQQQGLTAPDNAMDVEFKAWLGGVSGIVMQESSLGYFAGVPLFGQDNLYPSVPLPIDGGNGGCLTYFVNTLITAKAPYPQEAMEFLLWANDPAHTEFVQNILDYHWYPVWNTVIKDYIEKDERYKWMGVWGPQIEKSVPYTSDHPFYNLSIPRINAHATKFWTGEYKSAEETAAALDKDVRDAMTKQLAEGTV